MKGMVAGLLLLAMLVALGAAWKLHGDALPPPLRALLRGLSDGEKPLVAAQPPRKCQAADGSLLYSTEACPAGTREQALQGGTLTVLAAPPAPPASKASAQPLLQRLDDPAETERMRERRLQRAFGE